MLVGALGTQVTQAGASEYFCDWDPLVAVVTPGGNVDLVYVSVYTQSPLQVGLPVESYTATRGYDQDGNPVTNVDIAVHVPAGLLMPFHTYSVVSTGLLGSGQVLAANPGNSGQTTHLRYTLHKS
jgi:hypothetical protein